MTKEQPGIGFDEIVRLAEARRSVGPPSAVEIEAILRTLPEIKSMCKDTVVMNKDVILEEFSQHKSEISIPKFCAIVLADLVEDDFLEKAGEHFAEGRVELFRGYHDLGVGSGLIFGGILSAESELSNPEEKERSIPEIFAYRSGNSNSSTTQDVETYLLIRKFSKEALGRLLKDKTGMLLIDDMLDGVKSGSLFKEGAVTKEYAIAGAELGADLYKQLYRMIEQYGDK